MINVSQAIKNSCKADKNTHREYIILNGQTIDIKGKLSATAYKDTSFIGTFNMKVLQFETENTTQFRNREFEYYKEIDGNAFKIGSFITTEVKDNDSTGMVKVTANDYGLKFAVPYITELDYSSGEITLFQVLQECCTKAGVVLENQSIDNGSFIVDSNQFVNGELIGDVVSAIAGISCNFATINNQDQLSLRFTHYQNKIINAEQQIEIYDLKNISLIGKTTQSSPSLNSPKDVVNITGNQSITVTQNSNSRVFSITLGNIELNKMGSFVDTIYKKGSKWYLCKSMRKLELPVNSMNYNTNRPGWRNQTQLAQDLGRTGNLANITSYFCNIERMSKRSFTISSDGTSLLISNSDYPITQTIWKERFHSLVIKLWYGIVTEPEITEITDETLISELNNIEFYTGINTITPTLPFQVSYYDTESEILEDYSDLDDKRDTQPITSVSLGMSNVEGSETYLKDDTLIDQYGEHWLKINDNPFAYTLEKRQELITNIFNKIKGFGYSSFKSKYTYRPYLELGDNIKFKNKNGELINSAILRYEFNYDDCTFEAPSITSSSIDYETNVNPELQKAEVRINQELNEVDIRGKTINLTSDLIKIASTNFSVDEDGKITSTSGDIGGFHIGQDSLWNSVEEYATWQSASGKTYKYNMNDVLGAGTYSIRYGPSGDAPQEFLEQYGFSTTAELIDKWDATLDGQVRINDVMKIATFVENSYASNISLNAGVSGSPANIVLGGVHSTEAVKITSLGEIILKDDYAEGSLQTKSLTLSPTQITFDNNTFTSTDLTNFKNYEGRITNLSTDISNLTNSLTNSINALYHYSGESVTLGANNNQYDIILNGLITSDSTDIYFNITTPKKMDNVSGVSITSLSIECRGIKGYLNSQSGYNEFVGRSGYTIYTAVVSSNQIGVKIIKSSAWGNATNNTPISLKGSVGLYFY